MQSTIIAEHMHTKGRKTNKPEAYHTIFTEIHNSRVRFSFMLRVNQFITVVI